MKTMTQITLKPTAAATARRRHAEAQSERERQLVHGVKGDALINPTDEAVKAYIKADPMYRTAAELRDALTLLLEAVEMDIALFPGQPHKESSVGKARAAIAKARAV
jgi:hypothetical protein